MSMDRDSHSQGREARRSVPGMAVTAVLLALFFIFGPYLVPIELPTVSYLMLNAFGVFLLIVGMTVITITRLYHRAPADEAFVRTGMGGPKVVLDGGSFVVPVVHEVIWLSLRTMRFEVSRFGPDALLTKDYLRVDITSEFFIRVPKVRESVLNAATSLGSAALSQTSIQQVLEKKLESAIRQVAAEMELEELLRNRAIFIEKITEHVRPDIEKNGLALENVTISKLDQTPARALQEDNIFDAQGRRKIAEIVTAQRVATSQIELSGQQRIAEQTTTTRQAVSAQEVLQAEAVAGKDRDIRIKTTTAQQEADTAAARQDQLAKVAGVERDKAVQVAEVRQAQEVEVAGQEREKAVRTAEIEKDKATEVADRQRQVAVAKAEQERATAEAQQLAAEAERAGKEQEVHTVQVVATAERNKQQVVIAAQADAEKQRVAKQVEADVAAYTQIKTAEGEKAAAALKAEAVRAEAEARSDARTLEARGDQALQMVPVDVDSQRVNVESARVEVQRQQLVNQSEHESIAKELQISLAEIAAGRDVQIEQAKALGVAFSSMNFTVWGDPSAVSQMTKAFYQGQGAAHLVNGFLASAPETLINGVGQLISSVVQVLKEKGLPVSEEMVKGVVEEAQKRAEEAKAATNRSGF